MIWQNQPWAIILNDSQNVHNISQLLMYFAELYHLAESFPIEVICEIRTAVPIHFISSTIRVKMVVENVFGKKREWVLTKHSFAYSFSHFAFHKAA